MLVPSGLRSLGLSSDGGEIAEGVFHGVAVYGNGVSNHGVLAIEILDAAIFLYDWIFYGCVCYFGSVTDAGMRTDGAIIQRYIFTNKTRRDDGYIFAEGIGCGVEQLGFIF